MKKTFASAVLWMAVMMLGLAGLPAQAASLPDFTQLVENNRAAVVNISTTQKLSRRMPSFEMPDLPEDSPFGDLFRHFFDERRGNENGKEHDFEVKSLGSGFIISEDGYVLTNNHVVKDAEEIIVRLYDRRELQAKVVGRDTKSDIALIKIEANNLPVAKIGDSTRLKAGEWVLAIGSPFGFEASVTAGIVSAVGRSLPSENYVPFIQTDVAINPGNSGGPLYNLNGEVVGVNSQIYSRTGGYMGLSFSIPIEMAMEVADQLKQSGHVQRGWLGVLIQDVTRELAESFGMERPRGALVARVLPDGPAEKAGLRPGDVILSFNEQPVERSSSLPPLVGRTEVGKTVTLRLMRAGKIEAVKLVIGELPADEEIPTEAKAEKALATDRLGLSVSEMTPAQRKQQQVDHGGVLVNEVAEGAASHAGVHQGDVILMLNQSEVQGVEDYKRLVDGLPTERRIALLVQRQGSPMFLTLQLK